MGRMDASQSALDSLRTVEFRETLKGYHRDDVDEYLEKAAVEAEGLQEQLRQGGERLRQAAERISQLEEMLENQLPPPPPEPPEADDTLQRTLLLAQKFVDQTKSDSEAEALRLIGEAEAKARAMTDDARSKADTILAQSEQQLRQEIARLEDTRGKLTNEVEFMSRHLESERARLRQALTDILKWVDANVHPETSSEGDRRPAERSISSPPPTASTGPASTRPASTGPSSTGPGNAGATSTGPGSTDGPEAERQPATAPAGEGKAGEAKSGEGKAGEGKGDEQESETTPGQPRPAGAHRTPGNSAVLPI